MGGGTDVRAAGGWIECEFEECEIVLKRVTGGGKTCDRIVSGGEDGSEMGMEFDGELNAVCSGGGLGVCGIGGMGSGCCCGVGMVSVLIVVSLISGI